MINNPKGMETLNRLLDEVRAEMAAGRISFSVKGFASPPRFGDLTVDLLPPSAVTSGEEETITLPGYEWPIKARPFGVDWSFNPKDIDMSTGEPIVQTADGYWVWGRGCTQQRRHHAKLGLRPIAERRYGCPRTGHGAVAKRPGREGVRSPGQDPSPAAAQPAAVGARHRPHVRA